MTLTTVLTALVSSLTESAKKVEGFTRKLLDGLADKKIKLPSFGATT
jgi:hypothetical protein